MNQKNKYSEVSNPRFKIGGCLLQLNIDYPETLPDAIGQTKEQFEQEAKWAMAIKLFEMKRLSSGQAAALIGTDRVSFLPRKAVAHPQNAI